MKKQTSTIMNAIGGSKFVKSVRSSLWILIPLTLILVLIILQIIKRNRQAIREGFETSTESQVEAGASGYYDWDVGAPEPKKEVKETEIVVEEEKIKPYCEEKPKPDKKKCKKEMAKCPIEWHPDIDKYILKTKIPPEPDMNEYIKKTDIPPYPDMNDYIKKTDIPKCPACPTCPMCPNVDDTNIEPSKPKHKKHHKHHKYQKDNQKEQNDYYNRWNETNRLPPSSAWEQGFVSPFTDGALPLPEDIFNENLCRKEQENHTNVFDYYKMPPVGDGYVKPSNA